MVDIDETKIVTKGRLGLRNNRVRIEKKKFIQIMKLKII